MMRYRKLLLFIVISAIAVFANAEETSPTTSPAASAPILKSHELNLVLFQVKRDDVVDLSHDEVMKQLESKSENVVIIESIRLSAIQGMECMMQMGRQQSIVVSAASATPQRGAIQSSRDMQVGTMVNATVEEANDKYIVDLRFENSRIQGDTTQPGGSTIRNLQTRTSVLLEKGKLKMVGGSNTEDGVYLAISLK